MTSIDTAAARVGIGARVVNAVLWRSGTQVIAQIAMWSATFFVIRLLDPSDYGLYSMTQSVLVLLTLLNGQGLAGALVRAPTITRHDVRQVFGMLLLLNGGIALLQIAIAPFAAQYFHHPIVARMLMVQALLYLSTPFIVLPSALLAREMDFRRQAKVNLVSAAVAAASSLGGALAGLGVWTLVFAPIACFWTRAIGMTIAARMLIRPSFDFTGARATFLFGSAILLSDFLWLVQSQADVYIGGRAMDAHRLGLYTTALFLAQIVTAKFIPPLNDVAFTAYARLKGDAGSPARAFEKSLRIIMMLALPFYVGLAITARPFVLTMLGEKWAEAIPIVAILACAMPFVTVQILLPTASTALGHTRIQVLSSAAGAVIMPLAFVVGVRSGPSGMAWAWLIAFPLLLAVTARLAMPVIGTSPRGIARAIAPAVQASAGMAVIVKLADLAVPVASPVARLAILVALGGATYAALAMLVARPVIGEMIALVQQRRPVAGS